MQHTNSPLQHAKFVTETMAFISSVPVVGHRARSPIDKSALKSRRTLTTGCVQPPTGNVPNKAVLSRRAFLATAAGTTVSLVVSSLAPTIADTASDVQYNYVKKGTGPSPDVGDLVGIRFKGAYNGVVFDNLFESPEPYFYRAGSGAILQVCFKHSNTSVFKPSITLHRARSQTSFARRLTAMSHTFRIHCICVTPLFFRTNDRYFRYRN